MLLNTALAFIALLALIHNAKNFIREVKKIVAIAIIAIILTSCGNPYSRYQNNDKLTKYHAYKTNQKSFSPKGCKK